MSPNDWINITALEKALGKLDQPLPSNIQTQLNQIGESLKTDFTKIAEIDEIAQSYPPLKEIYQKERIALRDNAGERNKGLPPLPLTQETTTELTNAAINTFTAKDSVTAAKTQPNILQKIWQLIKKS